MSKLIYRRILRFAIEISTIILGYILLVGLGLPALVSADDTFLFVVGIVTTILSTFCGTYLLITRATSLFNDVNKLGEVDNETV